MTATLNAGAERELPPFKTEAEPLKPFHCH
jgi:hypothetical protein